MMELTLGIISLLAFCSSSFLIGRAFRPASAVEFILVTFTTFTSLIIASGYLLSSLDALSDMRYWSAAAVLLLFLSILADRRMMKDIPRGELFGPAYRNALAWFSGLSPFEKALLLPPCATLMFLGIANLVLVIFVAPHNLDSLEYHLSRMAYYLQSGNLGYFEANYWAQVIHPKNSTILLSYAYLASGRNENLTQLVQFASYLVSISVVYATSRRIGSSITSSVFAATVFGLLIECLMESVTAQNDFVWTAFLAIAFYAFMAYRVEPAKKYLALAAAGIAIAVGVKATTFTAIPSLVVVLTYALTIHRSWSRVMKESLFLALAGALALFLFILPAGYFDNYVRFRNPMGPAQIVNHHSFAGRSPTIVLQEGSKNILRYAMDFISLDGLPQSRITLEVQKIVRSIPNLIVESTETPLDSTEFSRTRFAPNKVPNAHEDLSSWGILGFSLVWSLTLTTLFGKTTPTTLRVLAIASIVSFISLSFAGPYDQYTMRYFLFAGVLSTPIVGYSLKWSHIKAWRAYLMVMVMLACVSAISAVLLRPAHHEHVLRQQDVLSLLRRDRVDQLTTNCRKYYEPVKRYEARVPPGATVAVCLLEDAPEYPLFGEKLTRTLIPVNSFLNGLQPIPVKADFLLFTSQILTPSGEDEFLGETWYLRKLK